MADTPVSTIDATGIHVPSYDGCLSFYQDGYRSVYGADVNLDNATQDGQWIAFQPKALHDANSSALAAYNAFSPSTAQGTGLSSVVKINGIARKVPGYSTADVRIIGVAGSVIADGVVQDVSGKSWSLPATVTIPSTGEITVAATCQTIGAVAAEAGSITTISTPTLGWQSVINPAAATIGAPVESDAALRIRQTSSTALPSQTLVDGLYGALAALPGVGQIRIVENDTPTTDLDGIPGHCLCIVIDGGDPQQIANTIALKKGIGVGTYGTTTETVTNRSGVSRTIGFFRPTLVPISALVTVRPLQGFTAAVKAAIIQAVSDAINALSIGVGVMIPRLYVPAQLNGATPSMTYEIVSILIGRDGNTPMPTDLALAFNETARCDPSYIAINIATS